MRKTHMAIIVIASLLLVISVAYGLITLYAKKDTLPKGVSIGGWEAGGQPIVQVRQELDRRLAALEQLPLQLRDSRTKAQIHPAVSLTLKEAGIEYHAEAFRAAVDRLEQGSVFSRAKARWQMDKIWQIEVVRDSKKLPSKLDSAWEEKQYGLPVNAVRQIGPDDTVRYLPGKSVYRIDWPVLHQRIQASLPPDLSSRTDGQMISLSLPLRLQEPAVTIASLKQEGIERKIIQFSTSLGTSSAGRVYNVSAAARTVDGMVLAPGEIFDYGKVIKEAEKRFGFREAPVIIGGHMEPGIGGGICQVSSTLYNAALRTGLEIVERRHHSVPVRYLPKGQDATFSSGSINFRFRNTTGKYLLIRSTVSGGALSVKFFGTFPQNVSYTIESVTVKTLPAPEKFIRGEMLAPGSWQVLQNGKTGYVIDTYRIKKVNGTITERIKISRDTYLPQTRLIATHSGSMGPEDMSGLPGLPGGQERIIEDGVSGLLQENGDEQ
ncbi:VanW family protein [Paenibacillus sp. JX-17]|uniref:VanW family protein n=1 Tax=Paenibacillus lacisoli TaxID=3064525 RepID=A0ABT9CDF2_9BACL|nr:VanW family protein [Paenibacillus sp. JX-17]MDO7906608.1 VanW family protein [Paenibacillus sp. JX-17]